MIKRGFTLHLLWEKKEINSKCTRKGAGFTLIELLAVIAVLMIILALSVTAFYTLTRKADLDAARDNIIATLNTARNKTLGSEAGTQYGIYFNKSSAPHKYVLFRGASYILRDTSFDEIHSLPSTIEISNIILNNGTNEVVFNRLEGDTNNYGTIVLHSLSTNETRDIYVYSGGGISTHAESASGLGRISDSRHVHFDLGWSITGASALKFNFINAGKIELVPMADYFTLTEFDWEGEFIVNSVAQRFRVHTHQLDPATSLCVHRDRNEGKNTEEVYIYIVQDSIEKEIAHYDNDQYATVYKGAYAWNQMDKQ